MKQLLSVLMITVFVNSLFFHTSISVDAKEIEKNKLHFVGTLEQTHNDNITFASTGEINDLITELSVGADWHYVAPRTKLAIEGRLNQQLFWDETDFNNLSEFIDLYLEHEITKFDRIWLTNTFIQSDEPRSFQDSFGRTSGRYSYILNQFSTQYLRQLTQQHDLIFQFANEIYDPDRADISKSFLNGLSMEYNYRPDSDTTLLGEYRFEFRDFSPGGEVLNHRFMAGVRRWLAAKWFVDGRLGIDLIDSDQTDLTRPRFLLTLKKLFDETSQLSLSFNQSHNHQYFDEDIFDVWQIVLDYQRQMFRRLKTMFSIFYGQGEFVSASEKEDFIGSKLSFVYDLSRDLEVGLSYRFNDVSSNSASRGYTQNLIGISVNWSF